MSTSIGILFETAISGQANARLAAEAGLPEDTFDAPTFERMPDQTTKCGAEILPRYDWNPNALKLCPGCIEDDLGRRARPGEATPHIRSWWMMFHVTACPFHNIRLVDRTSGGVPFLAHPMRLLRDCDPAGPLVLANLPRVKVAETAAERYVLGRVGSAPAVSVPFLDIMPLANAVRLMDRMGAVAIGGRVAYTHGNVLDQNAALNRGLSLFEGRCEGFVRLLDHLDDSLRRKRGSWGAAEVYGRAYRWLNEERKDPAYAPVIEIMKEHAHTRIAISPDVPFFGKLIGERRLYRLPHIYEASGVHMDKARKVMVALGEISPGVVDPLIPRERALTIIELLKSSMTYNDAREYLGLPTGAMRYMLDEGALKPSLRSGVQGLQDHLFMKADLDELVRRCAGPDPQTFERAPEGCGDIVQAGIRSNSSSASVLRLLDEGKVQSAGLLAGRRGLGAVLVEWKLVTAALGIRPEEIMTMTEAGRFLGVHHYTLRYLVDEGYIATTSFSEAGRKGTRATFITAASARQFMEEFNTAQAIAERMTTSVNAVVAGLTKVGIAPAISKLDAGRYYYRSSDLGQLKNVFFAPKRRRIRSLQLTQT